MHGMCTHTWWWLHRFAGLVGAAPPCLDNLWSRLRRVSRTVMSCQCEVGGDGHCRVMAKHGVGVEPLFCLDFWDRGRACARGGGVQSCSQHLHSFIFGTATLWLPFAAVRMQGALRIRFSWPFWSLFLMSQVCTLPNYMRRSPSTPCNFTIIMFDDRPLSFVSHYPKGGESYWAKTAILNSLYAKTHGYGFHYYHLSESCPTRRASLGRVHTQRRIAAPWYKLYAALQTIRSAPQTSQTCRWGMVIDSDAVIRNTDVPVEALFENISTQLGDAGWASRASAVFEFESGDSPALLNTGVWLFNYLRAEPLLLRWIHGAHDSCKGDSMAWPYEQGCLEKLLHVHSRGAVGIQTVGDVQVGLLRPNTMNQPHGWFVRHLWSDSVGGRLRDTVFDHLLRRHMDLTAAEWNAHLSDLLDRLYLNYHPFSPPYIRGLTGEEDLMDPGGGVPVPMPQDAGKGRPPGRPAGGLRPFRLFGSPRTP